ncbi:MAG: hypothetical protein KHY73_00655 [Fusobacterium nucleatum]|jgi:hypothetical protein|nr:hypothetical protein [Fusobacterium nucleatum]
MLKVIDTNKFNAVIGKVDTYKEAWELIYEREMLQSNCIAKWDKEQWNECDMQDEFPSFVWNDNITYVWTADWIAEVIPDPEEYNETSVPELIDNLLLSYKIEEVIV